MSAKLRTLPRPCGTPLCESGTVDGNGGSEDTEGLSHLSTQEPPMSAAYADLVSYVQHLAPTWRKTQHEGFAPSLAAPLARPTLCLRELARPFPPPAQPLHGRLQRLTRLLGPP